MEFRSYIKSAAIAAMIMFASVSLTGCNGGGESSKNDAAYTKKEQIVALENEPGSYREYALVSSGSVTVKKSLTTDGPLADVHANGSINARSLSLNISGKITASNNLSGSVARSFHYTNNLNDGSYVTVRALKVDEYLNTAALGSHYLLSNEGTAFIKEIDGNTTAAKPEGVAFSYKNNRWTITGSGNLSLPVVVQGDLNIQTENLFIAGALMVQGDLNATGDLNINTGTPFDKALIVDKNIEVEKLTLIGRVHGSGKFIARSTVSITGNAEIDGDVTLYGDARINLLDNVYKAALYEAQREAEEENTTLMLVHSQLFNDASGKNSVILFTFVQDNYIINENTLFSLIENNETEAFKFKSLLYGASIDFGAQLQKFDGLSPYYENKLALIKQLKSQGHESIRLSESLDIAPSNLYHTFEDANGNALGTYLIYSLSGVDMQNPQTLSQADREQAAYNLEHKDEIAAQQESEAKTLQAEQTALLMDSNETNETVKQEMLTEIASTENNLTEEQKTAGLAEATQNRVEEWVQYKELGDENVEINVTEILPATEETLTRSWLSSAAKRNRKAIKKAFKVLTFQDCETHTSKDFIRGVSSIDSTNDAWQQYIALNNSANNYCTPVSAAMIVNYHRTHQLRNPERSLYGDNYRWDGDRRDASNQNILVQTLASLFGTRKSSGTSWANIYTKVPTQTSLAIATTAEYYSASFTLPTTPLDRPAQHALVRKYIQADRPVILSDDKGFGRVEGELTDEHSMPVIGYKRQYYTGICWKQIIPAKEWLAVDSTWKTTKKWKYYNSRAFLRFDIYSNYANVGTITYITATKR